MNWQVNTTEGNVEINAFQLLNMLSAKVVEGDRPDHHLLANTMIRRLQSSEMLGDISPSQIASMALEVGYFYRIFKEKNDVIVVDSPEESSAESDDNSSV